MDLIPPRCLAVATIYGEAKGEPYEGKLAVAETIRRRMRTKYASKGTVASTVLRASQFSLWNTNDPGRVAACEAGDGSPIAVECARAWDESETSSVVPGAVLYHATYVKPTWAKKARFIKQIGYHLFYADPILDGHPGLEAPAPVVTE